MPTLEAALGGVGVSDDGGLAAMISMAERGFERPDPEVKDIIEERARSQRSSLQAKKFHLARKRGEIDETPTKIICLVETGPFAVVELPEDECYIDEEGKPWPFHRVGDTHRDPDTGQWVQGPVENEQPLRHGERYVVPRWCAEILEKRRMAGII
jgi:hypothetical protein